MGLCASKDKKDKVIEGDGAANATANGGEPNGTATTASAGEAAGQEGCVYSTVGEGRGVWTGLVIGPTAIVCLSMCLCVYLMLTSDCPKN